MKASDLKERGTDDLVQLRGLTQKELFQGRMKNCTNQLDDTSTLRKARRDIARIETILRERAAGARSAEKGTKS
jgi:large subunit ribosomal protein L29